MEPGDDPKSDILRDIHERVRAGVKAVFEQVLEEEMSEHLQAEQRQRTATRRGERNGHYQRDLVTPVGRIEQLHVPRDREGEFLTEVFERYKRMTGDVEDSVLEMYLQGVSTRRIGSITGALSNVKISKDAVSRIAARLEDEVRRWRERPLATSYPYLIVDGCYLKVRWGARVGDLARLVVIGINEHGYREVRAVESAAGERKEAYRNLFRGLLERGLAGVQLIVSNHHGKVKQAVATELPDAIWQRCVVHFERNVLTHVPARDTKEVAEDDVVFKAKRVSTARALAEDFTGHYRRRFPKAVAVFERGLEEALSFLAFPNSHQRLIRSTTLLERLFREVKRRTKVVGVFPHEASALTLCSAVLVRSTEQWTLRRYIDMNPLEAMNAQPTEFAT